MSSKRIYPRPFADEWRYEKPSQLTFAEKLVNYLGPLPENSNHVKYPRFTGTAPAYLEWEQYLHLMPLPLVIPFVRWAFPYVFGVTIHPVGMFFFYILMFTAVVLIFGGHLKRLTEKYGYLDGAAERDAIPRELAPFLLRELFNASSLRGAMLVLLSYKRDEPITLSWWLPLQLATMSLMSDFIYYWAHRSTHEVGALWKLHMRHHTTKHPNLLLLGYADEPQEIFDAIASPTIMYLLYPVSFDTFAIWLIIYLSIEIMGHSGLRMYYPTLLTSPFLRPFKLELCIEDHDLHHRMGWRSSYNYCKQSLLWDTLFGTSIPRIETKYDNVDFNSSLGGWLKKQQASGEQTTAQQPQAVAASS
ncbi:hypothetical protein MCUN1_002662 [Malassezia cuniculi]|uniref:Fatty acid hydroxylase domain-containing protein n=1 Tax=Malassezia cuniculi TaxID=948313 RepID=A0AAF0EZW6_9BASI|nr:hypothetical protein MCUN1_002662 [Malassezia cuniculi]